MSTAALDSIIDKLRELRGRVDDSPNRPSAEEISADISAIEADMQVLMVRMQREALGKANVPVHETPAASEPPVECGTGGESGGTALLDFDALTDE